MEDGRQLEKRFIELAERSFARGCYEETEFLSLSEQNTLLCIKHGLLPAPFELCGGYEGAERKLAVFGSADICGYEAVPLISFVEIRPVSERFAEELGHRDFLGALMSLGIKRGLLGDIIVAERSACVICLSSIVEFIAEQVEKVKNTPVRCAALSELPAVTGTAPEAREINVASPRADALISAVYKLSRGDSDELFTSGRVFLDGALCKKSGEDVREGTIVSVRGVGRFRYDGILHETKKGRLRVSVSVF